MEKKCFIQITYVYESTAKCFNTSFKIHRKTSLTNMRRDIGHRTFSPVPHNSTCPFGKCAI